MEDIKIKAREREQTTDGIKHFKANQNLHLIIVLNRAIERCLGEAWESIWMCADSSTEGLILFDFFQNLLTYPLHEHSCKKIKHKGNPHMYLYACEFVSLEIRNQNIKA